MLVAPRSLPARLLRHLPLVVLLVVALGAGLGCGGSLRVGMVNPRPRVVVGPRAPRYSVDVSAVRDVLYVDRVTIRDMQASVVNAFRNGVGTHFAPQRAPDTIHLIVDGVEADDLREGGRTVSLRYAGRWIGPSGDVIVPFQGQALPTDRSLVGKKNLEDVIGLMVEQWVGVLAQAQAQQAAQRAAPPPADTTPRLPPSAPPVEPRLPPNKPPGT